MTRGEILALAALFRMNSIQLERDSPIGSALWFAAAVVAVFFWCYRRARDGRAAEEKETPP